MASNGEQQHTPTPWFYQPRNFILGDQHGDEATIIAEVDFGDTPEDESVGEANARLIVRAVNSHEALLNAARKAVALMGYLHWESDPHGRKDKAEVYAELSVAIALAEKES